MHGTLAAVRVGGYRYIHHTNLPDYEGRAYIEYWFYVAPDELGVGWVEVEEAPAGPAELDVYRMRKGRQGFYPTGETMHLELVNRIYNEIPMLARE